MEIDATTFKAEQDGAFSVMVDKQPTRLVKESDLLSMKGANAERQTKWEKEQADLTAKVAEATKVSETHRQTVLQEQALREQLSQKYGDYDTLKSRVGEQEKEIATHKATLQKHQEEMAGRVKSNLLLLGASEESLKDKTLDQLRNLEDAAKMLGRTPQQPKSAQYDGGTGGTNGSETQMERAKRIIQEHESRHGKMVTAK